MVKFRFRRDEDTDGSQEAAAGPAENPAGSAQSDPGVSGPPEPDGDPVSPVTEDLVTPPDTHSVPPSLDSPSAIDITGATQREERASQPEELSQPAAPEHADEDLSGDTASSAQQSGESPDGTGAAPEAPVPLEVAPVDVDAPATTLDAGTVLGNRYVVVEHLTEDMASELLGTPVQADGAELYAVEDQRGYERCWACGSTANAAEQRFCTACGAPLQNRRSVLARTARPSAEPDEFSQDGFWFNLVRPRKHFDTSGVTIEVGGFSAEGPHHPNEDSYWSAAAGGCYDSSSSMIAVVALADGMGGYAPGSGLISRDIVYIAGDSLFNHLHAEIDSPLEETDLRAVTKSAIQLANDHVLEQIEHSGEMGATLVLAMIFRHTAYIANVGDSRAYYISAAGNVTKITRDQSLVEQQVAAGLLSPDAVYTAFGNNVILHAIGESQVEQVFDWYSQPLEPGSRLLLCSDGYWKTMGQHVWNAGLAAQKSTLRALAREMVEQAITATDDNTTVVLIGIE